MVSHWEAYIEDITSEAIAHIVNKTKDSSTLPKELKKQIATGIKEFKETR